MPHFMVRYDPALFLIHNAVFFLFSYKNYFHSFKQIFLADNLSAMLYRCDRSFVNHIGKIRANCT